MAFISFPYSTVRVAFMRVVLAGTAFFVVAFSPLLPNSAHAVDPTQLLDAVPSRDLRGDGVYHPRGYPPPDWTPGKPTPTGEWEHISRRPNAFGPRLLPPPPGFYPGSHAYSGSHGAIIPGSQYTIPSYSTGPDPAAMPLMNIPGTNRRTVKGANQPAVSTRSTTVTGRGVTPPMVVRPTTPSTPVQPSVTAPTRPGPASAASSSVQGPYSATPASPTGPVTPALPESPAVNSPSLAASTEGQGGVMDAGKPVAQPVNTNQNASGQSVGSVTGALRTTPTEVPRQRPPVLSGPAESLVIPPEGISLTPNNGAGALTSPPIPQ